MTEASYPPVAGIDPAISGESVGWKPPDPETLAGAIPHLEIIELIGHGGMGAVYLARQIHLHRMVAVRLLPPELGSDPAFSDRFNHEASALASLQHPHIVRLYDFGRTGSWLYLVMEYVEGANLRQLMAADRMTTSEALGLIPLLCAALVHAHARGVVHLALKPENIFIDEGGIPRIADFGLAKLRSTDGAVTRTGRVLGTRHHLAPEQAANPGDADYRADTYALGILFYELLTDTPPLERSLPPSHAGSDPRLDEVALKSLADEPAVHWQSAAEFRQAVLAVQALIGEPSRDLRPGKPPPRVLLAAAIVALPLLGYLAARATAPLAAVPPPAHWEATVNPYPTSENALSHARPEDAELDALQQRKSAMEQRVKDLMALAIQAQADASRADAAVVSAREQQARLATDIGRLDRQRTELEIRLALAAKVRAECDSAMLASAVTRVIPSGAAIPAAPLAFAAIEKQARASRSTTDLASNLPAPLPPVPVRSEPGHEQW